MFSVLIFCIFETVKIKKVWFLGLIWNGKRYIFHCLTLFEYNFFPNSSTKDKRLERVENDIAHIKEKKVLKSEVRRKEGFFFLQQNGGVFIWVGVNDIQTLV